MKKEVIQVEKKEINKEGKINIILGSLLTLILGVFLIIATDDILTASNYIFVSIFTFIGVIQFINFLMSSKDIEKRRQKLTISISFIWLALVMYKYYTMLIIVLPILFSLYLLLLGGNLIIKYMNLKNVLNVKSIVHLVLGILTIIVGALLIFEPFWGVYTYLKITGVNIILSSLLQLYELIRTSKVTND